MADDLPDESPNNGLKPPPEAPDPLECCGGGCVPCIFDYYELRLMRWEQETGLTLAEWQAQNPTSN